MIMLTLWFKNLVDLPLFNCKPAPILQNDDNNWYKLNMTSIISELFIEHNANNEAINFDAG